MIRPWEKKVTPHNKKGKKSSRQMEQTREKEKGQERKRNRTLLVCYGAHCTITWITA